MLRLIEQTQIYLARDPVDMRRQIDGLALQVQEVFNLDPFTPAVFAFCNRQRDKMKILYWHNNGFCLLYKRLEKGGFHWPACHESTASYTTRELLWLLDGLPLPDLPRQPKLDFKCV